MFVDLSFFSIMVSAPKYQFDFKTIRLLLHLIRLQSSILMNQDLIEKNYYEQLMVGHYIDVKYSDHEWKIAKILEKDKRYALVQFEAINTKQEQVYLHGYKVAPLRTNTEGYTGSVYKPFRTQVTPISEYKNHLEILQKEYLKQSLPSAFTSTQYLRGQLFVLVHSLLTRDQIKEEETTQVMQFLLGFIEFVIKFAKRIKKIALQYFEAAAANKMLYLVNEKVGLVHALNELLLLLNYILKVQANKLIVLFKCKAIDQQKIIKFFLDVREEIVFVELFRLNDGNGKWLPFNVHKRLYWLLKKFAPKFNLPDYKLKDYLEVFQIYPYVIKQQEKNNNIEQKYVSFIINCLKEQTSFEAKFKALQELKKIVEGDVKFFEVDDKKIFNMISQNGIIDHMLHQNNFNPQIFKRFTPILQNYCKVKQLSMKSVTSLFKLANTRHESEVTIIYEIICSLAEFIKVEALDTMYGEILKCSINSEKTISFLKNFTIKAITNYSKQKSFLLTFFKKQKNSKKYGNYALDLFFKELQDDGAIAKEMYALVFDTIKEILTLELFQNERNNYLTTCISWLQKGRNYGQAVRLIDYIVSTYPTSAFFGQNKKDLLQKLVAKSSLIQLVIFGSRNKPKNYISKLSLSQLTKLLYDFLDNYYDYFFKSITIEHIEYLWSISDSKNLSTFLKKPKIVDPKKKDLKQKYIKKIDESVQDDIMNKLIKKKSFFQRQLTIEEFEALDQIFVSLNLLKKKIEMSQLGTLRYLTAQMEGYSFYFEFISKLWESPHIERIIRKTISVFLRPKDQRQIQIKIKTWKECLQKIIEKLKNNPQICLKATSIFFEMIEGKLSKPNITASGNIDIYVTFDRQEKVITLPKNNTIFKLRKQIMSEFNLTGDFTLYSCNMRRDITYVEEQDYSLNALSTTQTEKGPMIDIINKRKEKHPQIQAVDKFKELIQKQENLYSILFSLNFEKINELFWKTIEMLPVNRQLIKKIENCVNFTAKEWKKLLMNEAKESLQYHLNIIYQILQKNNKWVALFYESGGFKVTIEILANNIQVRSIFERIINRCMQIILKVMQTVNEVDIKLLDELKVTLIANVMIIFKQPLQNITIPIDSLNLIFQLLNLISKLYKLSLIEIDLEIVLKILEYGVFKPTSPLTNQFIKQDFEYYLINHFKSPEDKVTIYKHLLALLNLNQLIKRENSELLYVFLIDFMNTFVDKEEEVVQNPECMAHIQSFIMQVLQSNLYDPSKQKYNHIICGAFKLLLYTLKFKTHTFNYKQIFDILLKKFLLNKQTKRVKHQNTIKALYECLKKLLFTEQSLIELLAEEVGPLLRQNGWRKNIYMNWSLQNKRQERSIYCGLQNLGATCYINCLMQQLFMIAHFRQNFLAIQSRNFRQNVQSNEIYQFQSIFAGLKYSNKRSMNTRKFCESFITYEGVPINPLIQSDADQFFSQLMEKIEFFLKENKRHDIIENTFQGKLSNQLNCQGCPHNSQKQENFMSIGVNIRGRKTLEQALEGYVQGEILDGDNAYFCQICQKKVRTQKRLCIKQLPNILIIVLKRFEFNYDQMRKIKINSYLNFPMQLNMKKYTADFLGGDKNMPQEPYNYFLRGTVIHAGTSEGGHYFSFINSKDKWYSFNDQYIEQINIKRVEQDGFGGDDKTFEGQFKFQKYKNAYILFYQKCNPPPSYHKQESEIVTDFSQQMQKTIIGQNNNSDFLSVMLDSNFNRLGQNFTALQHPQAYNFCLLYFHTVVLRDRNKEEYIPNYYRILQGLLHQNQISEWYLSQINHQFIKEFLIQAPRTVRFVCTSLLLFALKKAQKIPEQFVRHALFSLKKNGMTPFAKIFKALSQRPQIHQIMVQYQYPQRVLSYLMQKQNQSFKTIEIESFESYFGRGCSQKEKQGQLCSSALCQSLINFGLPYPDILQIFEKYYSRNGNKTLAKMLANKTTDQHLSILLISLESIIIKQGEFKREEIEKYMFLVRYLCLIQDETSQWRTDKCIYSLKKLLYEFRTCYQPMETLLRQLNYIAARSKKFTKKWKAAILQKQNIYDVVKTLKYWLKEAEHPQHLPKSEEFKRKVAPISYEEKYQLELQNKSLLERRINWMIEKEVNQIEYYESDIEDEEVNRQVLIRNKRFKLKQHLGLIKKIDVDGNQRWGILEKADFDITMSL